MFPYLECPRFNSCNTNICPLDPLQSEKNKLPEEAKCSMEKQVRNRIGSKYPELLKYKGLTSREWSGKLLQQRVDHAGLGLSV